MNAFTKFLSKSLAGIDAMLAIPAAIFLLFSGRNMFGWFAGRFASPATGSPLHSSDMTTFAIHGGCSCFCLLGFFLLWRVIRFSKSDGASPPPSWLWPSTTLYLLVITGCCAIAIALAVEMLRREGNSNFTLVVMAITVTLFPAFALILSSSLWALGPRNGARITAPSR